MIKNTLKNNTALSISEFDYTLPNEKIAKYPLGKRDNSKLLIYKDGIIKDSLFSSLSDQLTENDLLVVNNTKVIHSRLLFKKVTGAIIEIFCLEPHLPSDYVLSLQSNQKCQWKCLVGNLKRWKEGVLTQHFFISGIGDISLTAKKIESFENYLTIEFTWNSLVPFAQLLEQFGETPIPPYLNRSSENIDKERYQTVYAKHSGSAAAPTAGLHFTTELLNKIQEKGIELCYITLHVGLGTFKPVDVEDVSNHIMHEEVYEVSQLSAERLNKAKLDKRRIVAVGTTSVRTLESQMQKHGRFIEEASATSIFITPGYTFKAIDTLITNFHLPKSTLVMLVSAFANREYIIKAYECAIEEKYRFFSFGDSMIIQ